MTNLHITDSILVGMTSAQEIHACPKCHSVPKIRYMPVGQTNFINVMPHSPPKFDENMVICETKEAYHLRGSAKPAPTKAVYTHVLVVKREHLFYKCKCGFAWTAPTLDDKSADIGLPFRK